MLGASCEHALIIHLRLASSICDAASVLHQVTPPVRAVIAKMTPNILYPCCRLYKAVMSNPM
jgi:hypothetical protein